jgi:hypothetical protein
MTLLRPKNENDSLSHWPTSTGSSTSTCSPSLARTLPIRANCTWTTARSSMSTRSTSPAPNLLVLGFPVIRCISTLADSLRRFQCGAFCVFRRIAQGGAAVLDHTGSSHTKLTALQHHRAQKPAYRALIPDGTSPQPSHGCQCSCTPTQGDRRLWHLVSLISGQSKRGEQE